MEKAYRID